VTDAQVRFTSFPQTDPPPPFVAKVIDVFQKYESKISTGRLSKGLTSDQVLAVVSTDLAGLGFQVETGKTTGGKIDRPVFFGENGVPIRRYQIDGYHPEWRCGLEVEAGRAWMGNAVYRDLIQACVMVDVDHLCLAVSNRYRFKSGNRDVVSADYDHTLSVASALYGHSRFKLPYGLTVIGY
jgi:hypothetical protein